MSSSFVVSLVYHLQSYHMANRVQIPTNNSALIAMIADEVCPLDFLDTFKLSACEG